MRSQDKYRFHWTNRAKEVGSVRVMLSVLAGAVIVCTTSAIASRVYTRQPLDSEVSAPDSAVRAVSKHGAVEKNIPQAKSLATLTTSVLLTYTPRGFDQTQITVPAAPFYLLVENRSGLTEMSLTLRLELGAVVRAVTVPREILDWADLLILPPGNYVISETNHPNQTCRLTVNG